MKHLISSAILFLYMVKIMNKNMLETLIQHTELPEHLIRSELKTLIKKSGLSYKKATLSQLRDILAKELQDVILKAKKEQ